MSSAPGFGFEGVEDADAEIEEQERKAQGPHDDTDDEEADAPKPVEEKPSATFNRVILMGKVRSVTLDKPAGTCEVTIAIVPGVLPVAAPRPPPVLVRVVAAPGEVADGLARLATVGQPLLVSGKLAAPGSDSMVTVVVQSFEVLNLTA